MTATTTTTNVPGGEQSALGRPLARFRDLVAAEWIKHRSLRSTWIAYGATAMAVIGLFGSFAMRITSVVFASALVLSVLSACNRDSSSTPPAGTSTTSPSPPTSWSDMAAATTPDTRL